MLLHELRQVPYCIFNKSHLNTDGTRLGKKKKRKVQQETNAVMATVLEHDDEAVKLSQSDRAEKGELTLLDNTRQGWWVITVI